MSPGNALNFESNLLSASAPPNQEPVDAQAAAGRKRKLGAMDFAVVGLTVAAGGLLLLAVGIALLPMNASAGTASTAIGMLLDVGDALRKDIQRVVQPAMERTRKLAASKSVIEALRSGVAASQTAVCNEGVMGATEIDALALFDGDGRILAINTVYSDGRAIESSRVDRVMGMSFKGRDIIQSCSRNRSEKEALEFQTTCDITPAFFDSTGLSVAYSVPVLDAESGERIGVVSSRLRFERLTDLIEHRRIAGRSHSSEFITDRGGYFSEVINGQEQPAPIPSEALSKIVTPLVNGSTDQLVAQYEEQQLLLFRLADFATLDGGGIQVLLMADEDWIMQEARQKRHVQAGTSGLIGTLTLLVALAMRTALISSRSRRMIEGQKIKLENEMRERQAVESERTRLANSLVEASRRAGMAEVASGVLHNVGNALNSVNVSATLAQERVRVMKTDQLAKATTLIQENAAQLGSFFDSDERGKRLPGYLQKLAETLSGEQSAILGELGVLGERIDHIKTIVSTQQEYCKSGGLVEEVDIAETMDGTINLHLPAIERHGITIKREYDPVTPIHVDKHKLIQILMNLVNNALQAMRDPAVKQKVLFLAIKNTGERILVEVKDTGGGIAPENLKRIFTYGFTTKKDGHGFGLHSSANSAKELGGSLSVHSDGPGLGASFVLELPMPTRVTAS